MRCCFWTPGPLARYDEIYEEGRWVFQEKENKRQYQSLRKFILHVAELKSRGRSEYNVNDARRYSVL